MNIAPVIGEWYQPRDKGRAFQVVAIDDSTGVIEIQKFDGDIDEWDIVIWHATPLQSIAPPEDWSGPMDDIEKDDMGDTDSNQVLDSSAEPALNIISPGINTHEDDSMAE